MMSSNQYLHTCLPDHAANSKHLSDYALRFTLFPRLRLDST